VKKLLSFLKTFYRVAVIQLLPAGMVADEAAVFGLIAMMHNLNCYAVTTNTEDVAGLTAITLTASSAYSGVTIFSGGAGGGVAVTLPLTPEVFNLIGPTVPIDGSFSKRITFVNNGTGQTLTVGAGDASTTLDGTMTLANNTVRDFLLTITGATTLQLQNLGAKAI
jgi:hypothetical protein